MSWTDPSAFSREMLQGINGFISSKRVFTNRVVWAFIFLVIVMGCAISHRIATKGDVGWGAVGAFTAITAPLATLVGSAYRKKEEKADAPQS